MADEDEPDTVREARRLEAERRRRLPVDPSALLAGRPEVSTVQAMESLQLFAGTMLAHAGFEGAFSLRLTLPSPGTDPSVRSCPPLQAASKQPSTRSLTSRRRS